MVLQAVIHNLILSKPLPQPCYFQQLLFLRIGANITFSISSRKDVQDKK